MSPIEVFQQKYTKDEYGRMLVPLSCGQPLMEYSDIDELIRLRVLGIYEDHHKDIFIQYYRTRNSSKDERMGLSLEYDLLELGQEYQGLVYESRKYSTALDETDREKIQSFVQKLPLENASSEGWGGWSHFTQICFDMNYGNFQGQRFIDSELESFEEFIAFADYLSQMIADKIPISQTINEILQN